MTYEPLEVEERNGEYFLTKQNDGGYTIRDESKTRQTKILLVFSFVVVVMMMFYGLIQVRVSPNIGSSYSSPSSSNDGINEPIRHTYQPRGQPISDEQRQSMIEGWGSWTLVDDKERPIDDYYSKYPNRDIPRSKFLRNAWQVDKEYLSKFLTEGIALVDRAQKAILVEYGFNSLNYNETQKIFRVEKMISIKGQPLKSRPSSTQGGWTTKKSYDGLVRRLLHAIMTEDVFVFAMGGASGAAGHGNNFQQSYTSQVQWILEPIFARLGVRHQARNFGEGGLGTLQNGLGAGSLFGPDVDIIMWDSRMTESDTSYQEVFHRQAILGGTKVPILWSLAYDAIATLNINADADIGFPGNGLDGIPEGSSIDEIESMPWAMQYMKCSNDIKHICQDNQYSSVCWIDRDDYDPTISQQTSTSGRASWHPGWRRHQLQGRVLAYTILDALKEALTKWKNSPGYEISDDEWHVTDRYETVRNMVGGLGKEVGACNDMLDEEKLGFACRYPVKARSEFTGRPFPSLTNIRSLMPPEQLAEINGPPKTVYDPPDVFIPNLHPPPGAIDVLNIVEAGVDFQPVLVPDYSSHFYKKPTFSSKPVQPVGKGIELQTIAGSDDSCDGSVDSFCARSADNNCLLYGHNDGRNGLLFNSYSGWLVMKIPDLTYGFIVVKYESWHEEHEMKKTIGWTSINNNHHDDGGDRTRRQMHHRSLSQKVENITLGLVNRNATWVSEVNEKRELTSVELCDDFYFQYAIDGALTTLDVAHWKERSKKPERVVETLTLLEDPRYYVRMGGKESQVEIAIRITGCAQRNVFKLTHVYWA